MASLTFSIFFWVSIFIWILAPPGVNMFKFDGVAGNPTELAMEMEAMLRTIAALRNPKGSRSQGSTGSKGAGEEEDVWSLRCSL